MKEEGRGTALPLLWAPWRMEYIETVDRTPECIFCQKWKEDRDEENLILLRGKRCFIILNRFPYNNGHIMVVPVQHTAELDALSDGERLGLRILVEEAISALKAVMGPDGFNIGMNLGRTAGAGIDEHLHLHVVPRWNGDTNFMPVVGGTKVISEALQNTYQKLRAEIVRSKRAQ